VYFKEATLLMMWWH